MTDYRDPKFLRWGLLLVLLVAAVLRLGALPDLPLGLHYDEAANLILTRQIVEEGYRPLFIRAYTGKEVLFFYLAAPWVRMTDGTPWGLRLGAAMLGVMTVAATFAAVRVLLSGRAERSHVALFAAGWMALAFPHVLLSRYGFRAISQPLLQALTIAALWRGLRGGKVRWLIGAGVGLGLTAYTYLAARLFPVPLAVALGWAWVAADAAARGPRLRRIAVVIAVAAVCFAPLGVFFLQNPDAFLTRIAQVAASSSQAALDGVWKCLRALIWPGDGDTYVRFNVPGQPILRPLAAGLALLGFVQMLRSPCVSALETAGRVLTLISLLVMILPSALATGEITPSNLRMVGIYPLIALLPAWGLYGVFDGVRSRPVRRWFAVGLLMGGGALTAAQYTAWATSGALFQAADGEMVLASQALEDLDLTATTVYLASEHYRHPTVAALSDRYAAVKWLTGGATWVLPPGGAAVYLVPARQQPPAPWPATITEAARLTRHAGPAGDVVVTQYDLTAGDVATHRAAFGNAEPAADFAHITWLYDARPAALCRAGEPCPVLLLWEPRAPYGTLQPVVRLVHPETGEWDRTMAFHYPPEQWTPGDLVLDQLVLTPPVEMPPGDDYRIGVSFYDADQDLALPRLVDERFAGLEARFPVSDVGAPPEAQAGIPFEPPRDAPTPSQVAAACPGINRARRAVTPDLWLLGVQVIAEPEVMPGSSLMLRLCWRALADAPADGPLTLALASPDPRASSAPPSVLYAGVPAEGYDFSQWRRDQVVETRHQMRVPRALPAGDYRLQLELDAVPPVVVDTLTVRPVTRSFEMPEPSVPLDVTFAMGDAAMLRLLGYDVGWDGSAQALTLTLHWQAAREADRDYVAFMHLREVTTDALVAQIDEMPQSATATGGRYPTSLWMAGEVVADTHVLTVPRDDVAVPVALYVGLYLPDSGEHLTVDGDRRYRLTVFPEFPPR